MIKILEEKPVPKGVIECCNCGSILEYGNADLQPATQASYFTSYFMTGYELVCPVCGIRNKARWITNEE